MDITLRDVGLLGRVGIGRSVRWAAFGAAGMGAAYLVGESRRALAQRGAQSSG
jgi:hypothetical protein